MAGGWTSRQDSWGTHRYRISYDTRPRFYEFDSHPYLNSMGVGGIWTVSFILVGIANPSGIATVINTITGPLNLARLFSDPMVIAVSSFLINTVVAYIVRVSIGRHFKSTGVDLPQEAIDAWKVRKLEASQESDESPESDPE